MVGDMWVCYSPEQQGWCIFKTVSEDQAEIVAGPFYNKQDAKYGVYLLEKESDAETSPVPTKSD